VGFAGLEAPPTKDWLLHTHLLFFLGQFPAVTHERNKRGGADSAGGQQGMTPDAGLRFCNFEYF
jgi:hypothetical protein